MGVTAGSTPGRQLVIETDLPRLMAELDRTKYDVINARRKRLEAQEKLDSYKRSELVQAQQQVEIEKARLLMAVAEETDDKGKPKYSNESLRAAALAQLTAKDQDYREALATLRAAEDYVAKLQLQVQEYEDMIKSCSDLNWTLRSLVDGARAEIMAVVTLDGPKIPAEIAIKATDMPSEIRLTAPAEPLAAILTQQAPLQVTPPNVNLTIMEPNTKEAA